MVQSRDEDVLEETGGVQQTTAVRLRAPVEVPVPTAYRKLTFLQVLPAAVWRDVFCACGLEAPNAAENEFAAALADLLSSPQPALLVDALEKIAEIGTTEGLEILHELEDSVGAVAPDGFAQDATVQVQAARLWCLAQQDEPTARRLAIALSLVLARRRRRPALHFAGATPRPPKPFKAGLRAFRGLLQRALARRGAGEYLDIGRVPREERFVLYVVHGATRRSLVTVNDAETGRERRDIRPAVSDLVSYDTETGRLELELASVHLADDYRHALGVAFFEDAEFFAGDGGWSLAPLQRKRRAVFDAAPFSAIESATLRACIWAPSSGGRVALSHPDVFELVDRHALPFEDGELLEARFALNFRQTGRRRRVTVTVRPPNQLLCDDRHRAEVTRYFGDLGLRTGQGAVDLWNLGEGVHRAAAWRGFLGADGLALAIDEKILVPALIDLAAMHGAETDIVDEVDRQIVDDGEGRVTLVSPEDRQGYRLDAAALGRRLGSIVGISSTITEAHTGLLYIGDLGVGEHVLRVVLAYRDPGIRGDALRDAVRPRNASRTVVLLPAGRSLSGVDVAPIDHVLMPTRLVGRIAKAVELDAHVAAIETAPAGARLVVDELGNKVWFDDVELDLTPGQFDFVLKAAIETRRNRQVPIKDSGSASRGSTSGDRAAAKTKSELMARIRKSFELAGQQAPVELAGQGSLLASRKGWGYTFSVPVHVRSAQ